MLYRLAAWLRPDSDIELAVDWPAGGQGQGEGEGEGHGQGEGEGEGEGEGVEDAAGEARLKCRGQ
jgi:hypothetical protein